MKRTICAAAVVAAAVAGVMSSSAMADAWSFGVMADTQQSGWSGHAGENGLNTVSTEVIDAVNQKFIDAGVKFVVQVGDLTDTGSTTSLQTRWDHTAALRSAGIPFYGLRGNHEESNTVQNFFQSTFIPSSTADATVHVASFDNTSYSVTYNNTKIVLLDIKTADAVSGSNPVTTMTSANSWMSDELSATDHQQAFVFQHKNLLGQNHKDNQFGGANDPVAGQATTNENDYFRILAQNNVKYSIGGHDHMHHRSAVVSPDGTNTVNELICASDSTKFYGFNGGFSSRETTFADEQYQIGYYTFTVDGPRVTVKAYGTPNSNIANAPVGGQADMNGGMPATPNWTLRETFGYSLNGKQVTVASNGFYTGINDQIAAGAGFHGTSMRFLSGQNTTTAIAEGGRATADDLNTGWSPITSGKSGAVSDVLSIWGMSNALGSSQTDTFAVAITYDPSLITGGATENDIAIYSKDANGNWVNAVSLNFGGTAQFVSRAYQAGDALGTYGVDPSTHEAWAVLNHNSDFVAAVPEPGILAVSAIASLGLIRRRRAARAA